MSSIVSRNLSSSSALELGPPEYDIPRSNPYTKGSLSTLGEMSGGERKERMEPEYAAPGPEYAAPDEMNVFNNMAYVTNGTLAQQAEDNIYSTVNAPPKNKATPMQEILKTNKKKTHQKVLCSLIYALPLFLSIGLASAALVVVLLSTQGCNCTPTVESLNTLSTFRDRLDKTSRELEQSRQETRMLATLVAELSENTSTLLAPLVAAADESMGLPTTNITRVPHNCTTRVETQCRVQPGQRECQTPCVHETEPGTVTVNLQCIRLESEEPNPLIGMLDVTGGEALCLCYVVQVNDNGPQTHPVDCALRATRCSVTNLQV